MWRLRHPWPAAHNAVYFPSRALHTGCWLELCAQREHLGGNPNIEHRPREVITPKSTSTYIQTSFRRSIGRLTKLSFTEREREGGGGGDKGGLLASIWTSPQTSPSKLAVKSRISLWRMIEYPPVPQERAWSVSMAFHTGTTVCIVVFTRKSRHLSHTTVYISFYLCAELLLRCIMFCHAWKC